ncbi:hypothetical protein ACIQMO_27705 [Streptomyces sp. NPDC091406]|uniref:hypothetical protein n=1 Tax=Streptomyces sp. NPDC091406 TaxID=3366001 RepID=UPI003818645E
MPAPAPVAISPAVAAVPATAPRRKIRRLGRNTPDAAGALSSCWVMSFSVP